MRGRRIPTKVPGLGCFPSRGAAAKAIGISQQALGDRMRNGRSLGAPRGKGGHRPGSQESRSEPSPALTRPLRTALVVIAGWLERDADSADAREEPLVARRLREQARRARALALTV